MESDVIALIEPKSASIFEFEKQYEH